MFVALHFFFSLFSFFFMSTNTCEKYTLISGPYWCGTIEAGSTKWFGLTSCWNFFLISCQLQKMSKWHLALKLHGCQIIMFSPRNLHHKTDDHHGPEIVCSCWKKSKCVATQICIRNVLDANNTGTISISPSFSYSVSKLDLRFINAFQSDDDCLCVANAILIYCHNITQ